MPGTPFRGQKSGHLRMCFNGGRPYSLGTTASKSSSYSVQREYSWRHCQKGPSPKLSQGATVPLPWPFRTAHQSSPRDWSLIRLVDSRVWMALAPRLEGDSRVAERGCLPGCLQISIPSAVQIRKKETESCEDLERKGRKSRPVCLEESRREEFLADKLEIPESQKVFGCFP